MTNNNDEADLYLEEDLITQQIQKQEPQDLYSQSNNYQAQYSRDLTNVGNQQNPQQQYQQFKNQQIKQQQQLENRPGSSQKGAKQTNKGPKNQPFRPNTAKQLPILKASASTSNIVKTISQRMNNLENLTAQLKTYEDTIEHKTDEKNRLYLQVTNMKKEVQILKQCLENLDKSLNKMHQQTVNFKQKSNTIEDKQTSLYLELQQFSRETTELQQAQLEQEKYIQDSTAQMEFEKKACEDFNDYIKALKKKIADTNKEKDNIKARSISMQKVSVQLREKIQNQEKETSYLVHSMDHSGSKARLYQM